METLAFFKLLARIQGLLKIDFERCQIVFERVCGSIGCMLILLLCFFRLDCVFLVLFRRVLERVLIFFAFYEAFLVIFFREIIMIGLRKFNFRFLKYSFLQQENSLSFLFNIIDLEKVISRIII